VASKEIKQKIVLDGEKEYNQAIKEAQRNLKTLRSELKAETAELGKNATEQQKAEAKAKSLQKQIQEQEKIVKALRAALDEVKEKYGDNADEVAKWEQKLNNARTTLADMKNGLEGIGTGFQGMQANAAQATVATKSVADALGAIGSAGGSVSDAIEGIFTSMIDRVTDAAEQLWALISETAAKANNWTDLGSYYGSSAQEMQMWSQSIKAAGGDFEKFINIVNQLTFNKKPEEITELLGISKENYQNDVEYVLAVMDSIEQKKNQLGQGWYDETMTALFSRRSKEFNWFISNAHGHINEQTGEWVNGWRDNPQRFNGEEGGLGMTDKELGTMNDLYIKIAEIETKWDAIKSKFAAGFGGVSLDLLVNVEGTLDGIADYMNAKDDSEKQAALDKIRTNVEEFFTKLADVIRGCLHILRDVGENLSESDDPLTSAIGSILVKLTEGLQWMVDNQDAVQGAFEAIFGLWLLGKLAAAAGSLSSILMQIEAIKAFRGVTIASGAVEAAGASAGSSWARSFAGAAIKAVPWIAGLLTFFENAITPQGNDDLWDEEGNLTELGKQNGLTQTEKETAAAWRESEEGKNSIWGGKGDRIEAAGMVTRGQYNALNQLWENYSGLVKTNASQEELLKTAQKAFEGEEEKLQGYLEKILELRDSGKRPGELPLEWFGVPSGPEIEEDIDLDDNRYDDNDRNQAVQDWWDAWKNASKGDEPWSEEESAFGWFQEVFGDQAGGVFDRIIQKLDELDDQTKLEDIPEDWWRTTGNWNENNVTSEDLRGFRGLPASMASAVQKGAAAGVAGIRVQLDGRTVGELVAPYVSTMIARDIG
jgi:hypothetical protein